MKFFNTIYWKWCLALLLCLGLSGVKVSTQAMAAPVHVTVNFALNTPHKNMSGFMSGVNSTNPPDSMLQPLKPAFWRIRAGDVMTYNRAVKLGAKIEVSLSGGYGYPQNNWNGHGAPWENGWTQWDAYVRQMAQFYKNIPGIYWDVWNEPDTTSWNTYQFWNGTQAQFYETYRRAYVILRQELGPNAIIGGPSYANYEPDSMKAFMNYCNQNGLQVNFLSWHELMRAEIAIPTVEQHIKAMRSLAASMPNLNTQKIIINESVGPATQYLPGDILGFLYYLEAGGADGSNKGCWNSSNGQNNCFNNSVDGIIYAENSNINNKAAAPAYPRAAWWAYKTYADGINSRVRATSDNPNLIAMGSKSPIQILLGYFGPTNTGTTDVTITMKNLVFIGQRGNSIKVNVGRIPKSGESPLSNIQLVSSNVIPVSTVDGGTGTITIQGMNIHEEYVLRLVP